jgi:hypothetical protein
MVYASDPWASMHDAMAKSKSVDRPSGESFLRQAREFFRAAEAADTPESRPLLFYYSFMNLAKALAVVRGRPNIVGKAVHGVAHDGNHGHTVSTAQLQLQASQTHRVSVLDELHLALTGTGIPLTPVKVSDLAIHSVVGHRLWAHALDRKERFISVETIRVLHDNAGKRVWSTIAVPTEVLKKRHWSARDVLKMGRLEDSFRIVKADDSSRVFEMIDPVTYTGRAADVVMDVVRSTRHHLWQTVTSAPPYRRYYLYLSNDTESRLPQVVAVYMLLFWLGSLTRYQPVELLATLNGPLGGFFREFLATQPQQLLYILASEFRSQEVSRAAVV